METIERQSLQRTARRKFLGGFGAMVFQRSLADMGSSVPWAKGFRVSGKESGPLREGSLR